MTMTPYWYNFRTQKHDVLSSPPTFETAPDYIPKNPVANRLFRCKIAQGQSVCEAIIAVLDAGSSSGESQLRQHSPVGFWQRLRHLWRRVKEALR